MPCEVGLSTFTEWVERGSGAELTSRSVTKFRAGGSVEVEFGDFATLGGFVVDVAEIDGVRVGDVIWSLTDETRSGIARDVRAEAVRDAAARASAYAEALGLGNVHLDELTEGSSRFSLSGPRPRSRRARPRGAYASSSASADALVDEELEAPEDVPGSTSGPAR